MSRFFCLLGNCFQDGLRSIFRKRLRSFLTIFGIAIGVLSVVLISMIGELGSETINNELNSMGISGIAIRASEYTPNYLTEKELKLVENDPGVKAATPLLTIYSDIRVTQQATRCVIWGIDDTAYDIVSLDLQYGRRIGDEDIAAQRKVCLVDQSFAKTYYKRENIVGKTIQLHLGNRYEECEVIGVVSSGGNILQSVMGDIVPCFVYIPYTTMNTYTGKTHFSNIAVNLRDQVDEEEVIHSIVTTLQQSNGYEDSIKVENLNKQKEKLNHVLEIITLVLAAIGGISLVVAGLSIMTVMLVTVTERTKEIGIKKSIGASHTIILAEFLSESLLISLLGGLLGLGMAILILGTACAVLSIPFMMNLNLVLAGLLFAVSMGVVFGVYPAVKASRLSPVEALRHDG